MTLNCSESRNRQVFLPFMSVAKFSLNSERRTRSHSPQWWEMYRQVMRREITENSLAKAPPDHWHCPFHLSLLLRHMDSICVPNFQGHCTWHLMGLPQICCAEHGGLQAGNTSHPRRALSPLAVMGQNWLILLQGC